MKSKNKFLDKIQDAWYSFQDRYNRYEKKSLFITSIINIVITGGEFIDIINILDECFPSISKIVTRILHNRKRGKE